MFKTEQSNKSVVGCLNSTRSFPYYIFSEKHDTIIIKNIDIFRKYTSSKLSYLTNWTSTTNCIVYFGDILFGLKYA